MQLEMSISSEDWVELLQNIIHARTHSYTKEADRFFWEKYCSLHQKVLSYFKNIETKMFSEPSNFLQRIFLHRTQEYDGLNAKIGIPMAFKLQDVDPDATFTYNGASYADFYFLNKYRTVNRSQITEGNIEVGEKINVNFLGRPRVKVTAIDDDDATVEGEGGGRKVSASELKHVDRTQSIGVGQWAIAIREPPIERSYRCEVLSTGDTIRVKVLKHQGYPDNLVTELSRTRVTLTNDAFKKVFISFHDQLKDTPLQLVENIIKYLGRAKIRLSRLKKNTIETLKFSHTEEITQFTVEDSLFDDLKEQADRIDDDAIPGSYLIFEDTYLLERGIVDKKPRKSAWFKDKKKVDDIRLKFIQLARTMTTLRAMEDAFMNPDFLKKRVQKTIEEIVGERTRVQKLDDSYEMLLDLNQLYNYSHESLQDHYEGDELDFFIRKQMIPIKNVFDCREIEIPVGLEPDDESDSVGHQSSDFESDEEDIVTLIPETNANNQTKLRESQLIQWPVGEFKYWPKVKGVVDEIMKRERGHSSNTTAAASELTTQVRGPFNQSRNVFKSRMACMLTSNGRDFLEKYFEEFCLPNESELIKMYNDVRPSLNDIFFDIGHAFSLWEEKTIARGFTYHRQRNNTNSGKVLSWHQHYFHQKRSSIKFYVGYFLPRQSNPPHSILSTTSSWAKR